MTRKGAATRRAVLKGLALAAPAVALPGSIPALLAAEEKPAATAGGRSLLVLGGTMFLGPEVVEGRARPGLDRHAVQPRKTNPQLFPDLEKLHGDRDPAKGDGLKALEGRPRSGRPLVDTSGYRAAARPTASAALLAPGPSSTPLRLHDLGLCRQQQARCGTNRPAVGTLKDPTVEKVDGETLRPAEGALRAGPPRRRCRGGRRSSVRA